MKAIPYITFSWDAEKAIDFYKDVFSLDVLVLQRYKETPYPSKPEWGEKIMHSVLKKDDFVLMIGDSMEDMGGSIPWPGGNVSLTLDPSSKEDGKKYFDALSQWGAVNMPYEDAFWNATFWGVTDKFGVQWLINYQHPEK